MDKKRLRILLKVLQDVTVKFPNTKQFIGNAIEEECQKERIAMDEVIFYKSRSKVSPEKRFLCFAVSMLTLFQDLYDGTNYCQKVLA